MTKKVGPREVPKRDDFYMAMAFWAAAKSKDPSTQIGAFIISSDNVPQGWGYNGPPKAFNDSDINWARVDDTTTGLSKYDYMDHAEENAIDYSRGSLSGSTIYITAKPCKRCIKKIIKNGIRRVVYFKSPILDPNSMFADKTEFSKTDELASKAHIQLVEFNGNLNWMRDRMKFMETMGVFD